MKEAADIVNGRRGPQHRLLCLLLGFPMLFGLTFAAMAGSKVSATDTSKAESDCSCQYVYEYHSNGKIMSKVGQVTLDDGQTVFHCKTTVYFENGKPAMELDYRYGVPNGTYRTYYDNGKKELELAYVDGVPEGKVSYWRRNGKLEAEGNLHNGLRDGPWTSWHEDGTTESQGEFQQDKKVHVWNYRRADGSLTKVLDHGAGVDTF